MWLKIEIVILIPRFAIIYK